MSSEQGDRPPWDPANGLRVGLVAGALVGAAALAAGDLSNIWIVVVSAYRRGDRVLVGAAQATRPVIAGRA